MKKLLNVLSSRKFELLLVALFALVYLSGFTALRLVRDDWCSIANFARGLKSGPFTFIWEVVNNQWLGLNQSRIFFVAWLFEIAVGFFGRFNYVPYYLFILTWHLFSSLLLFRILQKHLEAPAMAGLLCCAYLIAPANTNVLFWLNNWFFSIPVFFLIAQVYFLTFPVRHRVGQIALLALLTVVGQFSGEQGIAMFYVSYGLFFLRDLITLRGADRRRGLTDLVLSGAIGFVALVIYIKCIMVYSVTQNTVDYSLERVDLYTRQFFGYLGQTINLNTEFYGYHSLPIGLKTIVLGLLEAAAVSFVLLFLTTKEDWEMPKGRALVVAAALFLYALAALLPCWYGALTGIRPGASWRYLFVPWFPICGFGILIIGAILGAFPRSARRFTLLPVTAFVIYLAILTTYTLNRVWRFQKDIDNRIWSAIDEKIQPRHIYVVTVNLSEKQAQLFPAYYSQAISDFQADWGIAQRLWYTQGRAFTIGQNVEEIPGSENLKVKGYYEGSDWEAPRDSILFATYRYGPRFANLKDAKLNIFSSYAEFKSFMEQVKR